EVDAVQQGAVLLVSIDEDAARVPLLRDVLRVRRIPLHDVLELAVAVDVGDRHVARRVGVLLARGRHARVGLLQRDRAVAPVPRRDGSARLELDAVRDRRDAVLRFRRAVGVCEVRAARDRGDPLAVAVHAKSGPVTPASEYPVASLPSNRQLTNTPSSVAAATRPRSSCSNWAGTCGAGSGSAAAATPGRANASDAAARQAPTRTARARAVDEFFIESPRCRVGASVRASAPSNRFPTPTAPTLAARRESFQPVRRNRQENPTTPG